MTRKLAFVTILSLLLVSFVATSASASDGGVGRVVQKTINSQFDGSEEIQLNFGTASMGPSFSRQDPPGDTLGYTWFDYQHNGTMGRQVAYYPSATYQVHFVWTSRMTQAAQRYIAYNAYDQGGSNQAWPGGKEFTGFNGGYTTMDVTSGGAAVVGWHEGSTGDMYRAFAAKDDSPPLAFFDGGTGAPSPNPDGGTINCEGWVTGNYEATSTYIWPVIAFDVVGGDEVIHMACTESPPQVAEVGEISTLVYARRVNGDYPTCAMAYDSAYTTTPVVRASPTSDSVALVWMRPIHFDGDPNDPCGFTQWQNDVYYKVSSDGGAHWGPNMNITDYTQGGTLAINEVPHLAYTDLSALYDSEGILHVTWSTPLRDQTGDTDPCNPLFASRLWHWDSFNDCISLVYDASTPRFHCANGFGAFNTSVSKMNISECDNNLYISFSRFGAHTSANGDTNADCSDDNFANSDIFLAGAIAGTYGRTWGPAINLTNTQTDECAAGDCHSEHWSSMAMYSTDNVHIEYIDDRDAGGGVRGDEGEVTENPVKYLTYDCFTPDAVCSITWGPNEVGYPTFIAPNDGSTGCTGDLTTTFNVTVTNNGSMDADYSLTSNASWLVATGGSSSGSVNAGCNNETTVTYTVGPIAAEGIYNTTIDVSGCGGAITGSIDVTVYVYCYFYIPESEILSNACWSIGVWNNARAGLNDDSDEGNMYWFLDEISLMFDESVVITYADDTTQTWFSAFDGSNSNVDLVAIGPLTTATFPEYEYAHGLWATGDTSIIGEIEFYLPTHPDTCVMIERIKVCNNETTAMTIHVGEAIDWDIPDADGGSENQCGADQSRRMVYQYGPPGGPEEQYYGGVSFCHENPGAIVLTNLDWVYPNSGYDPAQIGGLLARHTGFVGDTPDSLQDMNSFYVVDQDLVLEPDSCVYYCKVKASSLTGLAELQSYIDKGKQWIEDHEIECPGCYEPQVGCEDPEMIGDANGSGYPDPALGIDIDDVVYLIAYIFTGGPDPTPYAVASGDANCSGGVDIDDVVFEIAYIFTGGDAPCTCDEWVALYGPLQ